MGLIEKITRGPAGDFLLILLIGDLFFCVLHFVAGWGGLPLSFRITHDFSAPEAFQYLKFLWCAVLLIVLAIRRRAIAYLAWVPLMVFLLADDALRWHEALGNQFEAVIGGLFGAVQLPQKAELDDLGESLSVVLMAVPLLLVPAWMALRGEQGLKREFRVVFGLLVMLGFFGLIVDTGGKFFGPPRILMNRATFYDALDFVEDAGEMVVASLLLSYLFALVTTQPARRSNPLLSLFRS